MKNLIICISTVFLLLSVGCTEDEFDMPDMDEIEAIAEKLPNGFKAWANLFNGEGVGAIHAQGAVTFIFNKAGTQYAWFEDEHILGIRNLKDPESHFRNFPFENVGAVGRSKSYVDRENYRKNSIVFFDAAGTRYVTATPKKLDASGTFYDADYLKFNSKSYTPYDWGEDGTCPFLAIGAMYYFDQSYGRADTEDVHMISKEGRYLTTWLGHQDFTTPSPIHEYSLPYFSNGKTFSTPIKMNDVGAVTKIQKTHVFFTADGRQFSISVDGTGEISDLYDLYL